MPEGRVSRQPVRCITLPAHCGKRESVILAQTTLGQKRRRHDRIVLDSKAEVTELIEALRSALADDWATDADLTNWEREARNG
jgi:hypothetical protein